MCNSGPEHSQEVRQSDYLVQSAVVSWTACAGGGVIQRNSSRLHTRTYAFRGVCNALHSVVQPRCAPPSVQQASKHEDDGDHYSTLSVVQWLCVWPAGCRPLEARSSSCDGGIQQSKQGASSYIMRFLRHAGCSRFVGLCSQRCASGDTRVDFPTLYIPMLSVYM